MAGCAPITRVDTFAFERSLTIRVLAPARGARITLRAASMPVLVEAAIAGAWIVSRVRVVADIAPRSPWLAVRRASSSTKSRGSSAMRNSPVASAPSAPRHA